MTKSMMGMKFLKMKTKHLQYCYTDEEELLDWREQLLAAGPDFLRLSTWSC